MIIKNQKGGGLIMVIVVMAVLMILATTFLGLTSTEGKQTARYTNKIQAYHYAMAGIEFAFEVLNNNYMNGSLEEGFPEGSFPTFFYGDLEKGLEEGNHNTDKIMVAILEDELGLLIKSTGRIGDIEELVSVRIPKLQGDSDNDGGTGGGKPTLPADQGVIISGDIGLNGSAKIIGNVMLGGNVNTSGAGLITGSINNGADLNYPLPIFPQYPDNLPKPPNILPVVNGNLIVGQFPHQQYSISGDGEYNRIQVVGNGTLKINVGEGTRVLRVKELDIQQGNIEILGSGKLIIYIENEFQLNGSINNFGESKHLLGNHNQLMLFYGGTAPVSFGGNDIFVGNMFTSTANLMISGGAEISGSIVTGGSLVDIGGGTTLNIPLLYAPNAHVNAYGGGRLEGIVVANSLMGGGNVEFAYKDSANQLLSELIWGATGDGGGDSYGLPVWGN